MSGERPHHNRTDGQLFAAAAAAVARGDDLDDSLADLLGLAAEHLGASFGAMYIVDPDHDELELAVTHGVVGDAAAAGASVKPLSESHDPLADVARSRHPLEVDDAAHVAVLRGAATALLLPLVVRRDGIEVSLGVLALGFAGPLPKHETLTGAEPLADLAAVAIERALALSLGSERAEWFDRLAHTDPLTGLANRRTLDRMLELEAARAGRQGVPMSIAIIEIDRFSEIQKAGGNPAGDEALRRVAQVLAESVRLMDSVARFSDEQFILVAPGPDGLAVAERLVRAVAALAPVDGHKISVSAGIAGFPLDGRTPEELLAVAEKAVDVAREAGGDRVATQTPAD
ncbi:MAG: GGDEF domain-containing protein [Candidatus Limnocylindrales bacterium]